MKHTSAEKTRGQGRPVTLPERKMQIAALCYREAGLGREVLVITSRDTGRWILPKGWPIDGLDGPDAALQEAWEEAGVMTAEVLAEPVGFYDYDKGLSDGVSVPVTVTVYQTKVTGLRNTYPEVDERRRKWVTPEKAAEMVDEPDLKEILRAF